jgi:probable F420-dependent oxidoreductase
MKFGCTMIGSFPDLANMIAPFARAVEERGFDSLWIGEHTHLPVETRHPAMKDGVLPDRYKRFPDPWVVLAYAGAATTTLRLGSLITLVAEHNPLILAKQVATLDQLTRGRIEMGIGYGWNRLEMVNNGIDPTARFDLLREKVLAIKSLWTQEHTSFDGDFVRFSDSWSLPQPRQEPHPPILLGAAPGPRTFAHVIEFCDGYVPLRPMAGGELAAHIAALRQASDLAGRDSESIGITITHADTAYGRASVEGFARRLPTPAVLDEYASVGVDRVICAIPNDDDGVMWRALDRYAELCASWIASR